ncbi:MAG TPA: cytochrome c oxidase assembly protein [Gemmatimonadaceae bacterium]|jgi:cytochrome c oxidase assembly factor CtaG|nr:cytochrome c oxidase assembly protein [Gemmatimonadaceae bacterium]
MAPSPAGIWRAWSIEPGVATGIVVLAAWYAAGVRRLWRSAGHGRGIHRRQISCFAAALAVLVLALMSPLDAMSDALFSAHMVQHLALMLVVAPLLVFGEPLLPLLWALPATPRHRLARRWRHAPLLRAAGRPLGTPLAAWMLTMLALFFWHLPAPYDWALSDTRIHALEHLTLLGTSVLFWWIVFQPSGRRRLGFGAGVVYVATAGMLMGALGAILTFAPSPWYTAHLATTAAWHLSPLQDQQLAGVTMWVPASLAYLVAAGWLFVNWLGGEDPDAAACAGRRWMRI